MALARELPPGWLPPVEEPAFRPYWVLYIDLAGFSRRVADPRERALLARVYSRVAAWVRSQTLPDKCLSDIATGLRRDLSAHATNPLVAARIDQFDAAGKQLAETWSARVRIFSDSLFMFFDPDEPESRVQPNITALSVVSMILSEILWAHGLAHRGAISFGDCFLDHTGSIFLGEPIVEAYHWEREQQAFLISIAPSSLAHAARVDSLSEGLMTYDVPTRRGVVATRCIHHNSMSSEWPTRAMIAGFEYAHDEAIQTGEFGALAKYEATRCFFEKQGFELRPPITRPAAGFD